MSSGPKRKRGDRVAALQLPPGTIDRFITVMQRRDVLLRLALALVAMLFLWGITWGWGPAFPYRAGDVPTRTVVAHVNFSMEDEEKTDELREAARKKLEVIYAHNPQKLIEKFEELKGKVFQVIRAESFLKLDDAVKQEFFDRASPAEPTMMKDYREDIFDNFRLALKDDMDLGQFEAGLRRAFADYQTNGLIEELEHTPDDGTLLQIRVRSEGSSETPRLVETKKVRIAEVLPELKLRLESELKSKEVAEPIHFWLKPRLPNTLAWTAEAKEALKRDRDDAAAKILPEKREFIAGETILAKAGETLEKGKEGYELLSREYEARLEQMHPSTMLLHSLADFGMYLALYILCGTYIYFHQPLLLTDWRRYVSLLTLVVVTVSLALVMKIDDWQAEAIPLVLFAMTAAIAYRQEVGLLRSGAGALVFTVSSGFGLAEFTVLLATMCSTVLLLGRVRSRTKLLYVGVAAGLVAMFTSLGVGMLTGQNVGWVLVAELVELPVLVMHSLWLAVCTILSGLIMTGLLPFVEQAFDVQTDISLLELGDAAHPLLQELVRRAPGTYNHSINVASLAEAAADAIHANGLLCRVGAYFHDIGKMLKPGYFVENQGDDGNRHETLMPAMSTLVIIAHVKDGADLARQHGLPQALIDFIQQHHGTTLVEYFYRRASQQSETNPDASEVEESDFRYPGPKPQTREAGVLMLADAVESACRTLVEPTPSRIESLVDDIAMKRLLDGQFDEAGLTLSELRTAQDSLIKSLTAVYHGRVKYPDQQTA